MKKYLNKNSTNFVGDFISLKEARNAIRKKFKTNYKMSWFSPISIYQESDGTYSIENGKTSKAKFIEGVDPNSGRRFYWGKIDSQWKWIPKKKIQFSRYWRGI